MDLLDVELYRASLERLCAGTDLDFLRGRTVLVTGASGMLGSCLVDALSVWNREQITPCQIAAVSRNLEAAAKRFAPIWKEDFFSFHAQDVCSELNGLPDAVDYIIHAASNADPVRMAKYPANTFLANVQGTKNLLDYGIAHGIERFLFVSSGEVYGQPNVDLDDFTEDYCGPLDLFSARSCYPEGKRAAEVLCQGYISQYGVDAVIVRPCHLFGPTMTDQDSRAVSEFLRKAAVGEDIQLKSAGMLERSHCYVLDAVKAILLILKAGLCGQAYNIAGRQYQMTVQQFAEKVGAAGQCRVAYTQPSELETTGYSKAKRMVLDASRLEAMGWNPGTEKAIEETVSVLRELWGVGKYGRYYN